MPDFAKARSQMVDTQLRTTDVTDLAVLAAFEAVPREIFVPPARRPLAYIDEGLDLSSLCADPTRRTLTKPAVLAKLLQIAEIGGAEKLLVVGAATGYAAALAARLAARVVALECDAGLAEFARSALAQAGAADVTVAVGPLPQGWPDDAPYGAIIVCGAVEVAPDDLLAQLEVGGRLVLVQGSGLAGRGTVFVRTGGEVAGRPVFNAALDVLPGFARPKEFVF